MGGGETEYAFVYCEKILLELFPVNSTFEDFSNNSVARWLRCVEPIAT